MREGCSGWAMRCCGGGGAAAAARETLAVDSSVMRSQRRRSVPKRRAFTSGAEAWPAAGMVGGKAQREETAEDI
jgi:hypothetical protein